MESGFAAALADWHDFYAAVAGIAATLVGLLFVVLALNPRIMADDGPTGMRLWSALTFHNFLTVLVIALIALIPGDSRETIVITLLIVGGQGVIRVVIDLRQARAAPDPHWSKRDTALHFLAPTVAHLERLAEKMG